MTETHTLVHLLHQPGRAGQAELQLGLRGQSPSYNGVDHGQAARRHVQHPQDRPSTRTRRSRPSPPWSRRPSCSTNYGAMPADPTQQQPFFDAIKKTLPGLEARLVRPEGHARLPGQPQPPGLGARTTRSPGLPCRPFGSKYRTTAGLDIDAELATLKTTLQGIFDAYDAGQTRSSPPPALPGGSPARPGRRPLPSRHIPSALEPTRP